QCRGGPSLTTELTKAAGGITKDWHAAFSNFGVFKRLWLMRRSGPILQGILLERDSGGRDYLPTTHVPPLLTRSAVLTRSLSRRVASAGPGTVKRIPGKFHGAHLADAVQRDRAEAYVPLEGPTSLDALVGAIRRWDDPPIEYPAQLWAALILSYVLAGCSREAEMLTDVVSEQMQGWPAKVLQRIGGI